METEGRMENYIVTKFSSQLGIHSQTLPLENTRQYKCWHWMNPLTFALFHDNETRAMTILGFVYSWGLVHWYHWLGTEDVMCTFMPKPHVQCTKAHCIQMMSWLKISFCVFYLIKKKSLYWNLYYGAHLSNLRPYRKIYFSSYKINTSFLSSNICWNKFVRAHLYWSMWEIAGRVMKHILSWSVW